MVGRIVAVTVMLGAAGSLAAQSAPQACVSDATTWFNQVYKAARDSAARDSAAKPGAKPLNVRPLFDQRTARMTACASRLSVAKTSGRALIDLALLYSQIGQDSLAAAAVSKRIGEPGISEADSAEALATMIGTLTRPDTLAIVRAEPYMERLDRMSNAVVLQKIAAHSRLDGEYRYLDVDARIRQHSRAIIALARPIKLAPAASRAPDALSAFTVLIAYNDLAEVYGDMGMVDSALMVLDQAQRDHPEVSAADADEILVPERDRYRLVGTVAPPVAAANWLNAPAGTTAIDPAGKVTVIEFTAHWCIPCRNSYPSMAAMAKEFEPRGVRFMFATQFYGYFGQQFGLAPAAELSADRNYFVGDHGLHFPIGIADAPIQKLGGPYQMNPNDAAYHVGGIPQTVVIDRHGVIRRIMTGWDTGNAERIPALLTDLLHEPSTRSTP